MNTENLLIQESQDAIERATILLSQKKPDLNAVMIELNSAIGMLEMFKELPPAPPPFQDEENDILRRNELADEASL